ncbi:DUF1153 domain-containing protein [Falsirhodobacter sp. alg1]|uniref:CtrA inhibitor SciP n=1 Tax=Falsirhodobacter sp. alg1 TaxID=1472418 RepID=UPI0005EE08F5|nr:DUF1153 domain-containing protein [Falsirhodobacter sp. alg1]
MYLKKTNGPRQVILPDGSILTQANLPPPETTRWVVSRKSVVVKAVMFGLLQRDEALERYALSPEEFDLWQKAVELHGDAGLKVTMLQKYRHP